LPKLSKKLNWHVFYDPQGICCFACRIMAHFLLYVVHYVLYFCCMFSFVFAYSSGLILFNDRVRPAQWTVVSLVACIFQIYRLIAPILRNRRWGGSVYVLQIFLFFFVFFRPPKLWDNRSQERLNGFSWNFYQTIPGNTPCRRLAKVVPPPGEWRMLICVIYADSAAGYGNPHSELRYYCGAITRRRHARRLRYKIMSTRMDLI